MLKVYRNPEHLTRTPSPEHEGHYYPGNGKEEEMGQDHTLCGKEVLKYKVIAESRMRASSPLRWEGEIANHFSN